VDGRPDLGKDIHTLAGWAVRRIFTLDRPAVHADFVVRIPDLDAMPGAEDEESPASQPGGRRMAAASQARSRDRAVRSSPSSPSTSAAC